MRKRVLILLAAGVAMTGCRGPHAYPPCRHDEGDGNTCVWRGDVYGNAGGDSFLRQAPPAPGNTDDAIVFTISHELAELLVNEDLAPA